MAGVLGHVHPSFYPPCNPDNNAVSTHAHCGGAGKMGPQRNPRATHIHFILPHHPATLRIHRNQRAHGRPALAATIRSSKDTGGDQRPPRRPHQRTKHQRDPLLPCVFPRECLSLRPTTPRPRLCVLRELLGQRHPRFLAPLAAAAAAFATVLYPFHHARRHDPRDASTPNTSAITRILPRPAACQPYWELGGTGARLECWAELRDGVVYCRGGADTHAKVV